MFKLSQKSDYGLILLSHFASSSTKATDDKSSKYVSISVIANEKKLSPKFLSQIAAELKKAGILASREGKSGGYALAKSANEIKLLDVLKVLDGDLVEGKCFEDDHECVCGAKDMWVDMKAQLEETIGKKTVADLVAK